MESKFYIGQKVVAKRDHSQGRFKKGDIFTVFDIKNGCCFNWIKINGYNTYVCLSCFYCDKDYYVNGEYYDDNNFEPIQEQEISNMTYEAAIELVTEKQLT